MLETIKQYEQELKAHYEECRDYFGITDDATTRAFTQWMVVEELLTRIYQQQ
jgi:hypothetical protein